MRLARSDASMVRRSGGRVVRRTTVYFERKKFDRLRKFCFDNGLDLSDVVESAVDLHLDVRQGKGR